MNKLQIISLVLVLFTWLALVVIFIKIKRRYSKNKDKVILKKICPLISASLVMSIPVVLLFNF